jgi:hypothetical protein
MFLVVAALKVDSCKSKTLVCNCSSLKELDLCSGCENLTSSSSSSITMMSSSAACRDSRIES